jgi:hypothetical protein
MSVVHFAIVMSASCALMLLDTSSAIAASGGRPLGAILSGSQEVPPVETDGAGLANLRVNSGRGCITMNLFVTDTAPILAIHIHRASAGQNGPIEVTFIPFGDPGTPILVEEAGIELDFEVSVNRSLAKEIRKSPQDFYINVHTDPDAGGTRSGEIRGQLFKGFTP